MKNNDRALKSFLAILGAALFGGGIPVFGKIGLLIIPPSTFTFFRFALAFLCLLPFIFPLPKISKQILVKVFLVSLLGTVNVTLFAFGVRYTTATIAQLLYAAVPVISLILVNRLYGEKITGNKLLGISTGFVGVLFLILLPVLQRGGLLTGTLTGNLTVFSAVVSFSLYSVLSKKFQDSVSPYFMTFALAATTLVALTPMAVGDYLISPSWVTHLSLQPVLATFYVGIFGGAVYYLLYQYAIKHGGPVIASLTMFLQPAATYIWALLLLGERLTVGVSVGALLTIAGAFIVSKKSR